MFKIRAVAIDTYPENTAFLPRHDSGYGAEQFQALRKIEICHDGTSILATLAIMDDEHLLQRGEIGLGEQAFRRLAGGETSSCQVDWAAYRDLKDGQTIRIKTSALFGSCFSVATEHGSIHSFRWLNVALLAGGLVLLLVGIGVLPLGVLRESTD